MRVRARQGSRRRSGWVGALIAVLALVAGACGSGGSADDAGSSESAADAGSGGATPSESAEDRGQAGDEPTESGQGGDITVALGAMNPDLDAFSATSPPRSFLTYPVYSLMTFVDTLGDEAEIRPGVAESWERVDELVWEFTLREGLEFPNGEPVDSEAVIYSFEWMLDPENEASVRGKLGIVDAVEAVDDTTIRITMGAPEAILPRLLGAMPIVPPVLHEEQGHDAFMVEPVGTGWFMVEEFVPSERLVLVPNPDSGMGEAAPASITFVVIPEDAARVAALRAGDVDIITKVPIDQIEAVEGEGFQIVNQTEPRTYVVDLYTDEGPLADPRVRQALNHAIDQEALLEGIMGGNGLAAQGQLPPPFLVGFCDEVEPYGFDLERANELMAEAGVSGLQLRFQSSSGFLLNDALMSQAIGQMIEELDAVESVEIESMEFANYLDVFYGEAERADLFAWGMSSSPFVDASVMLERFVTDYPQHNLGYSNPEYDAAFEALRAAEDGSPEREAASCELSSILREDAPHIPVLHLPDIWAHSGAIEGFSVDQAGNPAWQLVSKTEG